MKRTVFIWALFFLFSGGGNLLHADNSWLNGFEKICIHTADAGNLSTTELEKLIDDSDALLIRIAASDDPDKKLYLGKLKKCRNFFVFMRGIAEKK